MRKRNPKEVTRDRAETMLARAVEGSRRLGMDDVADYYDSLSVDDYAEEKGLRLLNTVSASSERNSNPQKRGTQMDARTKTDLIDENNELLDLISDIWEAVAETDHSSSKEDLFDATEKVAELLNEYDPEEFVIDDEGDEVEDEAAA